MKKSSLIGHVIELLDLIRPLKLPADSILKDFFRARHYLGSKDRRFISETTYSILRNYRLLRVYAEQGMKDSAISLPHVPSLFMYLAHSLRFQGEAISSVTADVRGLLQVSFPKVECERVLAAISRSTLPDDVARDPTRRIAVTFSLPNPIVAEWITRYGESETVQLCESLNQQAPTTVRVNTMRTSVEECQAHLVNVGVETSRTSLSPFGLVLRKRVNVQTLQTFRDGWFEMQDEGSQLLSLLLEPKPGETIVDACAGGGGKTLHIAALMKNEGEIHALDVDEKRLMNIRPRLQRAGVRIVHLLRAEKEQTALLMGKADAVLVDAPCSGAGTFRRNPAAKLCLTDEFLDQISNMQRNILETYSALVTPGGRLVYTTCTLLCRENEDVVEGFLARHPEFKLISASEVLRQYSIAVDSSSEYLTLLPHKTGTDGFFAAVMQRGS